MIKDASYWIETLNLLPHPEGGYYKEIYRSADQIPGNTLSHFPEKRNVCTSIYFLLGPNDISHFHKIKSDELWFHHAGDAIQIHCLSSEGHTVLELGPDTANGAALQHVIPAEYWFASHVKPGGDFALVSCVVAPGFDFADFEMAQLDSLLQTYPEHQEIIERLTRK
jgi:uncharacterized protein